MRRSRANRGSRSRSPFAILPARLGFWLAALALFAQSLALAAPHMPAPDARSASAELSAILGPGVIVCAQADEPGAPPHHNNDCDICPLCQLAAAAAGLLPATTAAIDAPKSRVIAELDTPAPLLPLPRKPLSFSLARGPPSTT